MTGLLIASTLLAYVDSDLDGVEDSLDRCPNTPLYDLVDQKGCSVESLLSPHHFALLLGLNMAGGTTTQTLELDYAYERFSLQAYGAFDYDTQSDESGFNDTYLWVYYDLYPASGWVVRPGAGVVVPAYDPPDTDNRADWGLSLYLGRDVGAATFYTEVRYLFVEDRSLDDAWRFRDTLGATLGAQWWVAPTWRLGAAYDRTRSRYEGNDNLQSATIWVDWIGDEGWMALASYTRGLAGTAYDNYVALQVGYYF
ncbi:hypothetical protein [Hydrogenimonas sp.]